MLRRFARERLVPHLPTIATILALSSLVAVANAAPAGIMKPLIDKVLIARDSEALKLIGGGLLILFLVKGFVSYFQGFLLTRVSQGIIATIRHDLFSRLLGLPIVYFEQRNTGQILSRLTSDVATLNSAADLTVSTLSDTLTVVGLVAWILYLNWQLSLLSFLIIPAIGFVVSRFTKKARTIATDLAQKNGDLASILVESISGIRTVKSFSGEPLEIARFGREVDDTYAIALRQGRINASIIPVIEFLNTLGLTLVLLTGGFMVIHAGPGGFSAGALVSFLTALGMLFTPIKRLTNILAFSQQAAAALERIHEVLDAAPEERATEGLPALGRGAGRLEFSGVTFRYPGSEAGVTNVDFTVNPGQVVALVGPSGSGKSTLVNLLLRFYAQDAGEISIDGQNVRDFRIRSIRDKIGVVPQDTVLFSGSVADNIRYARPDADREAVRHAAVLANADEFIAALPKGYDTEVGERGVKLSGGQRQRIAIARAILRDPEILILDEATSALDTESEEKVKAALEQLMRGRTTLVIAHRLSTIRDATEILVLENGRITERGTHATLLSGTGAYQKLYRGSLEPVGAAALQVSPHPLLGSGPPAPSLPGALDGPDVGGPPLFAEAV